MHHFTFRILTITALLMALLIPVLHADAEAPGNTYFERTWARTDLPVGEGQVSRTWMWGPEAFTPYGQETYDESPGRARTVQYFDKSRMEINDPAGDSSSPWFVTNGLLVVEMVSGRLQLGDSEYVTLPYGAAEVNVAGDPDDPTGPTYASFAPVTWIEPLEIGSVITQRIDRAGIVTQDLSLESYNVVAGAYDGVTRHTIADPFWNFMNSSGLVWEDGAYVTDDLFLNPFYATGRPIVEPYWANVKVAGVYQYVLMQCFERRCLTYTPGNEPNWRVEAGNVGQHYYRWRYSPPSAPSPGAGLLLYRTDYENWTEWPEGSPGGTDDRLFGSTIGNAVRCGTAYCLDFPVGPAGWFGAAAGLPVYSNVFVSSVVRLTDSAPGDRACVLTRLFTDGLMHSFYAFCLTGSSDAIAFYHEESPSGDTNTWIIPPGEVNTGLNPDDWTGLSISMYQDELNFYVNGDLVQTFTHDGPEFGNIGAGLQRSTAHAGPTSAEFNYLNVLLIR